MFAFFRQPKAATYPSDGKTRRRELRLEPLEERVAPDTIISSYSISYYHQAAGRQGDPNPYFNAINPYRIDAEPGGYYLVSTGHNPDRPPTGGSVWSGYVREENDPDA